MEEPRADENGEQKKMANDEDLSNFDRGMIVGARQAGRSVSETADLLGFSHTAIARVFKEWSEKEKITLSSERQFRGKTGQRKMASQVQADKKAKDTKITTSCEQGVQKSISERTTRRALKKMGYSKKSPRAQQNSSIKDGENVVSEEKTLSEESQVLQTHSDGRARINQLYIYVLNIVVY